jgi:hypothetical protein
MSAHRTTVNQTGNAWAALCADCSWSLRGIRDKVQAHELGKAHEGDPREPSPEIPWATMPAAWDPPRRRKGRRR